MRLFAFAVVLVLSGAARADDWPQWLGPKRDAVWREDGVLDKFPAGGPKVEWKVPVGAGYSGPAVANGRVYVMDRVPAMPVPMGRAALGKLAGNERVRCLDAATGKGVWTHEYDCLYEGISYPEWPRTTPLVEGDRVYTLGTMGDLKCLDAATGKSVWAVNFVKEFAVKPPAWGFAAHLLSEGKHLVTLVGGDGGAVRAFDKATGKEAWKALTSQEVCYAPPVAVDAGGKRQVIAWLSDQIAGLDPATGATFWRIKHPVLPEGSTQMRPAVAITTPRVVADRVYVSTAYEGCLAVRLAKDKPAAEVAWKSEKTYPKTPEKLPTLMTSILERDGHLFCVDMVGKVRCVNADTGAEVWDDHGLYQNKDAVYGTAFWVRNGDRVFALNDVGYLVICKLTAKGYEEIDRAHVIDATFSTRGRKVVWAHPAFAGKRMFARNDKEIVCVSLAKS